MNCDCRKLVEYSLQSAKGRAKTVEADYQNRLESFRRGIAEGAKEMTARFIYRAGVYLACLHGNLEKNPSDRRILAVLTEKLPSIDGFLYSFFMQNRLKVEEQATSVDPQELLRRILRKKEGAPGLLEANAKRELEQAREALARVKKLEEYLASWREMRMESHVNVIKITDMHQR